MKEVVETLKTGEIKILSMSDISKCPGFILFGSHYRADGTCRHDEPNCEAEDCHFGKYREEIYCAFHLETLFGLTAEDLEDE